jgi:hypothetical protein
MESRTVRGLVSRVQLNVHVDIPLEIVKAGDHWSRRMSKQMEPLELMLGW